jgi:hypothetical protein
VSRNFTPLPKTLAVMVATQKSQRKRPAASQAGPSPKKVHLDKEKSDKKRSRPITIPAIGSDGEEDMEPEGLISSQEEEDYGDEIPLEGGPGLARDSKGWLVPSETLLRNKL